MTQKHARSTRQPPGIGQKRLGYRNIASRNPCKYIREASNLSLRSLPFLIKLDSSGFGTTRYPTKHFTAISESAYFQAQTSWNFQPPSAQDKGWAVVKWEGADSNQQKLKTALLLLNICGDRLSWTTFLFSSTLHNRGEAPNIGQPSKLLL